MQLENRLVQREVTRSKANPILCITVGIVALLLSIAAYRVMPIEFLFVITGVLFLLFLLVEAPKSGLYLILLIMPAAYSIFLDPPLLGISGLKIPVVLPIVAFLYLFFVVERRKLAGADCAFFWIIFISYTIAIARSFPYLREQSLRVGKEYTLFDHLTTNYLRPIMIFLLMIIIAAYIKNEKDIKQIMKVLFGGVLVGFALVCYTFAITGTISYDIFRDNLIATVGIHSGYFANFFVVLVPVTLLLAIYMKWRVCYLFLAIELVSVALTFSRASYVVVILSIIAVLIVCKKYLAILIGIIASPVIYMLLLSFIVERAMTGIAENDYSVISAGRIDSIWKPLIQELSGDMQFLLFGNGRYGIHDTTVYQSSAALNVNNAHNILLDMVCDGGIILLVFFIIFFVHYLRKFYQAAVISKSPLNRSILLGTCIGVGAFLLKGMTDGVLWPESSNAIVYVMMGLSLAIAYRIKDKKEIEVIE